VDAIDRLGRIDLNLLVSLYVLLDERNVTRAAERLFITQPAASRTLTRLRELFDDPLLTRSGSEMVMTPRAQQLKEMLPHTLEAVGSIVAPVEFDPATHQQTFRIALPEIYAQSLVPGLLKELVSQAPNMKLQFHDPDEAAYRQLLTGEVDFLVRNVRSPAARPPLHSEPLAEISPVLAARPGHPLARNRKLSIPQVLKYPWIDVFPTNTAAARSPLDLLLDSLGFEREVIFRSTHLLSALEALEHSDCLLYLARPGRAEGILASHCTLLAAPREIAAQQFELELLQHRRSLNSDAHGWLKEKLHRLISKQESPGAR
jgi:DNA-binding transcriptional LysR family regulator